MRLLLAVVALATLATALPEIFMGRRRGGFTSHLHENRNPTTSQLASAGTDTFLQKQDHFDASNAKTWAQRFFFNHAYAKDAVNILYLAGEQIDSVSTIVDDINSYVYYAEQLNADLYSLEHRYYGKSHPTDDTSVQNLQYLSSRQAIEDIAEFIRQINKAKGGEQKWIIVGGSYAGALSAWARLKHPELISGSIASSGPVLAQLDFYGYLQTVDDDFKKIGGLCYDQISAGLEEARKLLQSPQGRDKLTTLFKITPPLSAYNPLSDYDIYTFYSYLVNAFMGSAQYSQPKPEALCRGFTTHGAGYDPLEALKGLIPGKMNVNFTQSVVEFSGTKYVGDISMRLWFYQTCTEFGYFQSTDRGTNVFGQTQTVNAFIEYCVQLFDINADQIQKGIDATNAYYGERDYYKGTNVVFSHGTQDPWSFLTKKSGAQHPSVVILEVDGGSHCEDIGLSCFYRTATCTQNMKDVQTTTLANMRKWIDPVNYPVPDSVDIPDTVGKRPQANFASSSLTENVQLADSVMLRAERLLTETETKISKKIDFKKWNKFTGKGRKVLLPPPMDETVHSSSAVTKAFIEQTWDHFNPSEKRTFKQKWYSNLKFGSTDGPNFLMIGGEGPESASWVTNEQVAWMTYAKAVGANVFLLEHRYYGESKLGTNDLQYLTSAQMLYDVATFIQTQKDDQKLTGPWITFGGSYPGALAAWSREWFPELILGAVGSSGPVLAKNDFYEYLEVVESVIKRQSQKCYDRTADAFASLQKLAQDPEGRATIQQKFNFYPAWTNDVNATIDALDMNDALSALYGLYQGTVQYNSVDWSDVAALCHIIENTDKYPNSLDALSALRMISYGPGPLLANFDLDMQYLIDMKTYVDGHDATYSDDDLSGLLWTWQTCNEFGYYQTTDYGDGIFNTPVPVNFFIVMCEKVFGVGMDQVTDGIANTNYQYGGRSRYDTTNVVLPNGDGDPWHALGILEQGNMDDSVVPIVINGTSHCADMYGAEPADPPELTQARKTILANIQKWLAAAKPSPYCNCVADADGLPVGWNYNDIWLDIVVILDASEAMGKTSLDNAGALVESFIGSLVTDTTAAFYTRVGVISMADTATTLYNLNMKKGDKVQATIKSGVSEINVVDAFNAAQNMFADGLKTKPDRANTRQVIYYMTDSNPKNNLDAINSFKATNGVVIVNNFLKSGETALSGLKNLASAGYYFTTSSNTVALQTFCKANCFCKSDKTAYGSGDQAIIASGGCYKALTAGANYNNAKSTCANNGNGIIATVHDGAKGSFLQQIQPDAKSDYFWIGYTKSDAGVWTWEDQSTDSYTNWAPGEPSTASVAKCAYEDTSAASLPWGAGNCQVSFPYVCQYAPCSVGNKSC